MADLTKPGRQDDFAALVGISQPAVADLVRRGVIRPGDTLAEQLLGYCGHLRAVAAGRVESPELTEQRTRVARTKADRDELRLRREIGELVDADGVRRALADIGTAARDAWLSLPDRLAATVAAETDTSRAHALLLADVERTISTFSAAIVRLAELNKPRGGDAG